MTNKPEWIAFWIGVAFMAPAILSNPAWQKNHVGVIIIYGCIAVICFIIAIMLQHKRKKNG